MVQPITKPVSPLRGGTSLQIIPLPIQTFTIHVPMTIIINQLMESSERSDNELVEPINLSFTILDRKLYSLEFISNIVPLTPHQ